MALIAPHGADELRPLIVDDARRGELEAEALTLPSLMMSSAAAANAVMMGAGYFTPLTGYMNRADALSVAENMRTSDGSRIAHLGELDAIKVKAEGCVEKLNEAEKLDNLRLQVENAFRSDNLPQMAQSLGTFRASLVRSVASPPRSRHCRC